MPGYLGDKSTNTVHLLSEMKRECKIVDIKMEDRQYFTPDNLDIAKERKFFPCKWCIT